MTIQNYGEKYWGIPIKSPNKLSSLIKEIDFVLLAIPSIKKIDRERILSNLTKLNKGYYKYHF